MKWRAVLRDRCAAPPFIIGAALSGACRSAPPAPYVATQMSVHKAKQGLDIPISGTPSQTVSDAPRVSEVAVLNRDYHGLKARVLVEPGDNVRLGQPVLEHRSYPSVRFVSPASGRVQAVHRGDKRALQSVVIAVDANEAPCVEFASYSPNAANSEAGVRALLLESGLWTALRTRPFSLVPAPESRPHSLFVTALDTHPLAPDVSVALQGREEDFARGLAALKHLTDGPVFLCRSPGSSLGNSVTAAQGVRIEEFSGQHPAGTVGYHIHVLDPVNRDKSVWHIGAQDVARFGGLLATGALDTTLVIALAGPQVKTPRLLRTRMGASTRQLTHGELHKGTARVISGSVLTGDVAQDDTLGFLGRFHQQLTVIPEGGQREFLGWLAPGANTYSALPTFISALMPGKKFNLDTSLRGSRRAMVPIGAYEQVMPMDLMPTHLLRALTVGDVEWAEELGALELDEEDLALCAFVCPGKYEHGAALRRVLTSISAEH